MVIAEFLLFLLQANNCNTYHGVLEGNWTGTYDDGVSPTAWNGSQGILEKFMENVDNQMLTEKSVKYGQCWVFSGLLTTCKNYFFLSKSGFNFFCLCARSGL